MQHLMLLENYFGNMKKIRTLLLTLSIFLFNQAFCQDSLYRKYVDSILISRSKSNVKRIKVKNSPTVRYTYYRDSKELVFFDIFYPRRINDEDNWYFNYHFVDGQLLMINKYNGRGIKDKRRKNAFYYFRNGLLVFKEENKTSIENPEKEFKIALDIKLKAPTP